MKHRPLRIIPIPRDEPDLQLLAQALIALVREQREKQQQSPKPGKPKEGPRA
jgi:hypothetical protein